MLNLLTRVFTPGAGSIVLSAVVTAAVTAIGLLIADASKIINPDFLGGLALIGVVAGLKALQKMIANYADNRRIQYILQNMQNIDPTPIDE